MNLASFLESRRSEWDQLERLLDTVEGSGLASLQDEQAVAFARLYRRAASDLNQAQTFVSGDATVQYLNHLVARCYLVIHSRATVSPWQALGRFVRDYPVIFRRHLPEFLLATAILFGSAAIGFVACFYDAAAARSFLLPADMSSMIQPGRDGDLMSTAELTALSNFYFRHNLSVALVTFALGFTLGIGSAWLLVETGVQMGALAAIFVEAGEGLAFCTGILPHGVVEIPAILIAAAGGFVLAQGIMRARPWPRREELARTGKEALWLVAGCVPLLAAAALLEAVVARAPDWVLDKGIKLMVAGLVGAIFCTYVFLCGWRRPS